MKFFSLLLALGVMAGSVFAKDAPPGTGASTTTASTAPVSTESVGAAMTDAAAWFLDGMDPATTARVKLLFDDPRRLDWHNIPKPDRKGLPLSDMTEGQREACHALLQAALSETGYQRVQQILALEHNLREGEKGRADGHVRDPQRYFLTIFGSPRLTGSWGWSFEGHHVSLNFVVRDCEVVADTPSFWGACPATVKTFVEGGPEVGARALADEEQLAFDLLGALDEQQLERAVIADRAPEDYRNAGLPEPPQGEPEGLAAAKMSAPQQEALRKLLTAYCGHLAEPLAAARLTDIEAHGWENVHFAWLGARKPGVGHAYRVQGPSFVLELVNFQADPAGNPANHIHSVWRTLPRDFGLAVQ